MSSRTIWMALGAGLLAGATIAAYRARQRARHSSVGPEYLDRWKSEASPELSTASTGTQSGVGLGVGASPASRTAGNGSHSAY